MLVALQSFALRDDFLERQDGTAVVAQVTKFTLCPSLPRITESGSILPKAYVVVNVSAVIDNHYYVRRY